MKAAIRHDSGRLVDVDAARFTLDLSDAIDRYTLAQIQTDPFAYRYHGVNLRYAAERWLFFSLVNDDAFYAYYRRLRFSPTSEPGDDVGTIGRHVAPHLFSLAPTGRVRTRDRAAAVVEEVKRRLQWRLSPTNRSSPEVRGEIEPGATLYHILQDKFAAYLAPIIRRTGGAFLVVDDAPLFERLSAGVFPVAHVKSDPGAAPEAYLSETMKGWSSMACMMDVIRDGLEHLKPRCVVFPEGNAPTNEIVHRVARSLGISTICIQQGWSPLVHSGFRNFSYTAMCVWGEAFADALRPYNRRQRFIATGNHVVTFREPAEASLPRGIGFFAQKGSRLITDRAWSGFLELARWAADEFPDTAIYMREHPSEPLSLEDIAQLGAFENLKLAPPSEVALDDLLARCCVVVSIFSTTLIEGVAAGAMPLIINTTGMDRFDPDLAAMGAGVEVKDFFSAREALRNALAPEALARSADCIRQARDCFFAADADKALDNIVSTIERV